MSLKDEILLVQEQIKTAEEIAQLEDNIIKAYLNVQIEKLYIDIKSAILKLAEDGRKNFNGAVAIELRQYRDGSKISYKGFIEPYHYGSLKSSKNLIDAFKAINYPAKPIIKDATSVNDMIVCEIVKCYFTKYAYCVNIGKNLSFIMGGLERLVKEDGIKLKWSFRLTNSEYKEKFIEIDLSQRKTISKLDSRRWSFVDVHVIVKFSYSI